MSDVSAVRPGLEADWPGFAAAFELVAAEGRFIAAEIPLDHAALRSTFDHWVTSNDISFDVAQSEGGQLVGWAISTLTHGRATVGMGIVSSHRGIGLGSALLRRLITWATAAGAHKVELEVWTTNRAAIALYERFGFSIEGTLRAHWRRNDGSLWDCHVMGLVLDEH